MSKEAGKMNDTILEVKDLSVTFTQYDRGFSRRGGEDGPGNKKW